MGTNNLNSRADGQIIQSDDVNQFRSALVQDNVPRNSSGVPTDVGGGLGQSLLRWARSYFQSITIGTATDDLNIKQNGTKMSFEVGAVEKFTIGPNGAAGSYENNSIPGLAFMDSARFRAVTTLFTASATFTPPANIEPFCILFGCGGGGGGGGTGSSSTGGGAGGGGAWPHTFVAPILGNTLCTVTIGAGGIGGASATAGAGGTGGLTTFQNVTTHYWYGGLGGGPGTGSVGTRPLVVSGALISTDGGSGSNSIAAPGGNPISRNSFIFDASTPAGGVATGASGYFAGGCGGSGLAKGGSGGSYFGIDAPANMSGLPPAFANGGGGGGGACGGGAVAGGAGGAGSAGCLYVTYFLKVEG